MTDVTHTLTVEDVRKQALPLGTRTITGDGLLDRPVSWATLVYTDDNFSSKQLQRDEMVIVAPQADENASARTDVELVRWAADQKASAIVLTDSLSPSALAEAKAYGLPVMTLPINNHPRSVEKTVVSLLVDQQGQIERRGTQIDRKSVV